MHGPMINPGAPLGQTCGVGIRVGLCRAISSPKYAFTAELRRPVTSKIAEEFARSCSINTHAKG
ncbi:hypothetical protein DPMN_013632 [Dreissena polymorpha]|uniref:Uncharacterized protein n=1 Tax=Dreissena polymorpha TaxID=45954 RepID=A0A9D4S3Y2_DREPO|nr:hypothetical protein DPMN_013632 [Dreissena polymorpha]